jgi:ribosomal-protein-alanine N-acetyltransferase
MRYRVELVTERLHLRRARKGDAAVLFENYTGSQTCSRFPQRRADPDVARTQAMLKKWCDAAWNLDDDAPFAWVISTCAAGEAIGLFLSSRSATRPIFTMEPASASGGRDW